MIKVNHRKLSLAILGTSLSLTLLIWGFYLYFLNRIYPQIFVSGVNLTGLTPTQAKDRLTSSLSQRGKSVKFSYQKGQYNLDLSPLTQQLDLDPALEQAFSFGHFKIYFAPVLIKAVNSTRLLDPQIKQIAQNINQDPIDSQLKMSGEDISVTPSQDGLALDDSRLREELLNYLNGGEYPPAELPVQTISPHISYSAGLAIKESLDRIKLSPIRLLVKSSTPANILTPPQTFYLDLSTLLSLLDLNNAQSILASANIFDHQVILSSVTLGREKLTDTQVLLDQQKLKNYLTNLAKEIDQEVEEPLLNFDPAANGGKGRVREFRPPQEGKKLDISKSADLINQNFLSQNFGEISLPVETVQPKNKLVNDLGITELLGEGVSHFAGSIPNRIYNIQLAASRLNGILIPPGETFSYVNSVGDISSSTGFKQAYVIKSGRTVLDDGGGVCQDSTTLFRAVLNAGLPVVARTAHAYRVGYYEQGFPPGLDATIFSPSVDFQFKNDTAHHVLIQAYTAGETLYIDLYGTSDGRVSKVSTPVVTSQTPPPSDLHQDDPTLPKGTVKQVDFSAWGANVSFSRTVTRNNQILINETYRSNYRPWQAVYLVGTGG